MMAQPTSPSPRKPSFDLRAGCIDATAGCEKWTSGQILKGETSRYDEIKRRKIVLKKKKREKTTSIRRTQLRFYVFGLYLNVFQLATNSPRYVRVAAIKRPYTSMQVDRHHRQNGCGLWGALRRVANSASFCWTTTTGEGLYIITWIEAHDVDAGHVTTAWKGSRYWTAPLLLWSSPSCEQQQDEDGMQVDQSSVRRRSCELFVRRYWSICLIYRMMEKVIQRARPANQMHPKDLRRKRYSVQQANQRVSKRGTRRSP